MKPTILFREVLDRQFIDSFNSCSLLSGELKSQIYKHPALFIHSYIFLFTVYITKIYKYQNASWLRRLMNKEKDKMQPLTYQIRKYINKNKL